MNHSTLIDSSFCCDVMVEIDTNKSFRKLRFKGDGKNFYSFSHYRIRKSISDNHVVFMRLHFCKICHNMLEYKIFDERIIVATKKALNL